jgi:hypothetical protein
MKVASNCEPIERLIKPDGGRPSRGGRPERTHSGEQMLPERSEIFCRALNTQINFKN